VAGAHGRERGREIPVDPVAETDEDPGREPGLGLGDGSTERVVGGSSETLERSSGIAWRGEDLDRSRSQHADGADPREVLAVVALGTWLRRAVDGHPVAGHHHRPRREGRREAGPRWRRQVQDCRPLTLPQRPDTDHDGRPRPRARGQLDGRRRQCRRRDEQPGRQRASPGSRCEQPQPEAPVTCGGGDEPAQNGERGRAEEDGDDEPRPGPGARGEDEGRPDGAGGQPAAHAPVSGP